MAACHSGAECSAFGSSLMWLAASLKVRSHRPFGSGIGSSNRVDQGKEKLFSKMGAGPPLGHEATPDRAVRRPNWGAANLRDLRPR